MKKVTDFISNRTLTVVDEGKKVKFNRQISCSEDFSLEGRGFHLLDPLFSKVRDPLTMKGGETDRERERLRAGEIAGCRGK